MVLVSVAVFLVCWPAAAASDAGDVSADDGGFTDASTVDLPLDVASDGGLEDADVEESEGGSGAAAIAVIACDGALCDSVQGRPTCAVASSVGHSAAGPWGMTSFLALLATVLIRRAKRGT
jgi:hypothetical protein